LSIRREATYISTDVWRAAWLIARARERASVRAVTADEVIDALLRDAITDKYPQLLKHKKEVDELEKNLIAKLAADFRKPDDET
jgi:hypothetical protein